MTARERLLVRLNQAAHEALYRWELPTEIRGFSRMPCPGNQSPHYPCTAPDQHVGSHGCSAGHRYHHTNHPHDAES